jgi:hypothetical protein
MCLSWSVPTSILSSVPTGIFQTHDKHIFETQQQASTLDDDTMIRWYDDELWRCNDATITTPTTVLLQYYYYYY